MVLTIATRGSRLALWQAEHVRHRLEAAHPGLAVELRIVKTTGDRVTDVPLASIGDRALFTKEVDRLLLDGEADLAVHSLKDLPTRTEHGLAIAAVTEREDPRDVVVFRPGAARSLAELPPGARVGTSSLRRRAQLLARRSDLAVDDLRGNLDTRLARVASGDYDAVVLAAAGIRRLGRAGEIGEWLEPPGWLPAVGQGALGIVTRDDADATRGFVGALEHPATRAATTAERAFLNELEGGCQVPIGALADLTGAGALTLHGLVASLDGGTVLRREAGGGADEADAVGRRLAAELLARGADRVLAEVRAASPFPGATPP
ncbi:MAG TPA: hydroxymethylbilane synthase [Longimicrobiales bacterium]|nr:hydroxymethylbilane synthase [Longimicrobiales bacterium]